MVEFLNGQMRDTEVLIVEARQYRHENARIVPWVFGFSEEARVAKRESKAETGRASVAKGADNFWDSIESTPLSADLKRAMRSFVENAQRISGCAVSWQRGPLISLPGVVPRNALAGIRRDGTLEVYLARWQASAGACLTEEQLRIKDDFFDKLQTVFNMNPEDLKKKYPQISSSRWLAKAGKLEDLIRYLAQTAQSEARPLS